MKTSTLAKYKALKKRGLFKAAESGLSQPTISRLVDQGSLLKVAPGLFMHPESALPPEQIDYAVACSRFGNDVAIGGLSALFHYGLIEQVPTQVWLISNRQINSSRAGNFYRCLTTKGSLKFGVNHKKYFQMTSIERTLIEGMKFGSKIGKSTIIGAVRQALLEQKTSLVKIGNMADKLGLRPTLVKYWESIIV